jgi:hypothetical protein
MISFDWALKRLLRQKANFEILEGFLSELLHRRIIIKHIGKNESNQAAKYDETMRMEIFAEADGVEPVIIELQFDYPYNYFQRAIYGACQSIIERVHNGDDAYSKLSRAYSVNIIYSDIGVSVSNDYIYRGNKTFTGIHTNDALILNDRQRKIYGGTLSDELEPEYYIIKVLNFEVPGIGYDCEIKDTLDEWMFYLSVQKIRDEFTAQGMDKARKVLNFGNLCDEERRVYDRRTHSDRVNTGVLHTALLEGYNDVYDRLLRLEAISIEKRYDYKPKADCDMLMNLI